VHNLQLTRLWSARRFLLIEGDDLDLLKRFQDILFPRSAVPFDILPSMEINGWGGWNYVVGSSMFLENAGGEGITTYCILDADYHTREEIEARYNDARTRGVQLHIWNRKEIENYLLVPPAIQRIISASLPENARCPSIQEVADKLNELAFALRDEVFDNLASELHKRNRHWDTGTANKRAREIVNGAFATAEGRLSIISGKRALSLLTAWSKDSYNVSFSVVRLARELTKEEIAPEVQKVVSAIENNQELLS
jgi:hypothetical protein